IGSSTYRMRPEINTVEMNDNNGSGNINGAHPAMGDGQADRRKIRIAVELIRPPVVADIVGAQIGMKEHLQRKRAAPRCVPRQETCAQPGLQAVNSVQPGVADGCRPHVEVAGSRSGGQAAYRARIVHRDVHALGAVISIVGAAGDLGIGNLYVRTVDRLNNLEIQVWKIVRAPEANLRAEASIGLDDGIAEFCQQKSSSGMRPHKSGSKTVRLATMYLFSAGPCREARVVAAPPNE